MNPATLIARKPRLIEAEVQGEMMGLDVESGQCFGFNSTATDIWRLLERPQSLAELCSELCRRFDVSQDRCLVSVAEVIDQLASDGLVELTAPA